MSAEEVVLRARHLLQNRVKRRSADDDSLSGMSEFEDDVPVGASADDDHADAPVIISFSDDDASTSSPPAAGRPETTAIDFSDNEEIVVFSDDDNDGNEVVVDLKPTPPTSTITVTNQDNVSIPLSQLVVPTTSRDVLSSQSSAYSDDFVDDYDDDDDGNLGNESSGDGDQYDPEPLQPNIAMGKGASPGSLVAVSSGPPQSADAGTESEPMTACGTPRPVASDNTAEDDRRGSSQVAHHAAVSGPRRNIPSKESSSQTHWHVHQSIQVDAPAMSFLASMTDCPTLVPANVRAQLSAIASRLQRSRQQLEVETRSLHYVRYTSMVDIRKKMNAALQ
ncbi:Uncharacterized protein PBTT_02337 [Plasmodiophora brassicae]|nr:hypothetical protein PBRA_002879 [Plasmodiophora brassicae]